jgi:hypothetical protein
MVTVSKRIMQWSDGMSRRGFLAGASGVLALSAGIARADDDLKQSGTLTIDQVQLAFIGSGNLGGGTLNFQGRRYKFSVGGLGIGGFGISKITANGVVYNLNDARYFPGAYFQARYGAVVGSASTGRLWLKNANGVVLSLDAEREGLALSLGADGCYFDFD